MGSLQGSKGVQGGLKGSCLRTLQSCYDPLSRNPAPHFQALGFRAKGLKGS